MDISVNVIFVTFIASCFQGTHSGVTVSPLAITVLEGNNATARCIYDGENSLQGVTFSLSQSRIALIFLPNCTFNTLGFDNYITGCEGSKTAVVTLVNVSRYDHGKTLTCTAFVFNVAPVQSSSSSLLTINVPLRKVIITSENAVASLVSVCEKTTLSFRCETSAARPSPNISWVFQNNFSAEEISVASNIILERDENHLDIAASTLNVTANSSLNTQTIFCSASNILEKEVNSSNIYFNISYPPLQSPSILNLNITNGETYSIIEGRKGLLTCALPESNPVANLMWKGLNNRQDIEKSIVTNKLEWIASRQDTNISTCIAKHHCNNYEKLISVMIKVLYPPTVKSMKNISIIEGSMLNVTCNATLGKPKAAAFRWTRREGILITNSQILMISNISRDLSSIYTCTVANIMKPTYGNEVRGESSKSIYIDVLYPPTVEIIKDVKITEGSNFSLSCPINPGNPNDTDITWSANGYIIQSVNKLLSLYNVSRKHDMIYTCTVSNIMAPTDYKQEKGMSNESFHLIVEYSATIDTFFIKGHKEDRNVTLNEHENITFVCSVMSNPVSTIAIKRMHDRNLITANLNNVTYNLGPADCLDAGTYECSGRNEHNFNKDASRIATILVNCSPRAHPLVLFKTNLTTTLNIPVVIKFTALSFPLPTYVLWQKFKDNNWTNITSSKAISIRNSGLNFSLTIHNVVDKDLGHYRLVIVNDIGLLEQQFTIIAVAKRNQEMDNSRNVSLMGGAVGLIIAILAILVAIFILRRKVISKRKMEGHNIYQNDKGATPHSTITEYEEIQMHQHKVRTPIGESSSDSNSTSEMQYERLDQSKRENNDYSQISRHFVALCENRKGNNQCTLSGDLKEDTDVPVYTNLKI